MEQQEQSPDFLATFNRRLAGSLSLSEQERKDLSAWYLTNLKMDVKREIPAVLFRPYSKEARLPTDIWLEDPEMPKNPQSAHNDLRCELEKLGYAKQGDPISAYLIEEINGKRHLLIDEFTLGGTLDVRDADEHGALASLLDKYSVVDSIGRRGENWADGNTLEKVRERIFLSHLAQKYSMTNNQYMRLRILAQTLYESGQQVSLEEIASSIVNNTDKEVINVRNSLELRDKDNE